MGAFNKNVSRPDGLHGDCRECKKAYQHAWYLAHKEEHAARVAALNKRRDAEVRLWLNHLKDVPCADCGGRFPPVAMDFDHLPGFVKVRLVSAMTRGSERAIKAEIAKCEVVCANCHRVRTHARLASSEAEHSALNGGVEISKFSRAT